MKNCFFKTLMITFILALGFQSFAFGDTLGKDYNKDGLIDILDIAIMAKQHNTIEGSLNWDSKYDLNLDKIIDLYDIVTLSKSYGVSYANCTYKGNNNANINNGGNYAYKNGTLYTNTMDTMLVKTDLDGLSKEWISQIQYPSSINVTDNYIFYISGFDGKIYRANLDGSGAVGLNNSVQVKKLSVYKNYIYYINFSDNNKIYRMNINGGEIRKLTDDVQCQYINVTENYVYYINENNKICRIDITGGNKVVLSSENCSNLIIDGDNAYYTSDGFELKLYKMNLDGTNVVKLNDDRCTNLNISNEVIYYRNDNDHGKMYAIRTDGKLRTKITDENSFDIHVIGDYVYYKGENRDFPNKRVNQVSLVEDSTPNEIVGNLSENIFNNSFVVSDSKYYYQVSEGKSKIYRYNMDGTGKTLIHSDTNIYCVNLVGEWIYYTRTNPHNDYTYGIYKVKADGTGGLIELSTDPTEFMVVVGQWVYYVPYYRYSGAITGPDTIKKVNVDGTGSALIEKQYPDKAYYLMTQGDYIYYINHQDGYSINRIKKDGTEKLKLNTEGAESFSISGNEIYFLSKYDKKIKAIPLTGGASTTVINQSSNEMIVYNNKIYYESNYKIYSANLDGSEETYLAPFEVFHNFNITGGYLFYTSIDPSNGGTILNKIKLN